MLGRLATRALTRRRSAKPRTQIVHGASPSPRHCIRRGRTRVVLGKSCVRRTRRCGTVTCCWLGRSQYRTANCSLTSSGALHGRPCRRVRVLRRGFWEPHPNCPRTGRLSGGYATSPCRAATDRSAGTNTALIPVTIRTRWRRGRRPILVRCSSRTAPRSFLLSSPRCWRCMGRLVRNVVGVRCSYEDFARRFLTG